MTRALVMAALLATLGARTAAADTWSDAARGKPGEDLDAIYETQMEHGDEEAIAANQAVTVRAALHGQRELRMTAAAQIENHVDQAYSAYLLAAKAHPNDGEPYARIAKLIYSFYFEHCGEFPATAASDLLPSALCDREFSSAHTRKRAQQMIDAWDALEARAPLDARVERFERAIAHTKLATPEDLAAAARDYRVLIDHDDGYQAADPEQRGIVENNLAETDMMLGQLDPAIEMYRDALTWRTDISTAFGLAVALDRDGEGYEARRLVEEIGITGFRKFYEDVQKGETFFVPRGEVFYYLALAHETFGHPEIALVEWQAYIESDAHREYQPRAREHMALLRAQQKLAPKILRPAPPDLFDE